ncbi:uncharacterized protein LOC123514263 [Portunus trituberculatus]|uniref:uncharacterized protein LOC123514263 n=1 Tax=Portunus trituberculatus TaxID=210409 RepID=UPI001E1CC6BF|nr:uncharacterized protein LOC123514263 [Portunus trituberculatus]
MCNPPPAMLIIRITEAMVRTTTMGKTTLQPPTMAVTSVHGLQEDQLPGFYNSTCGPFTPSPTCFTQLNLQCQNGRCVCLENYMPNDSGGCKEDLVTMLVTWLIRLFISACIFLICLTIFHLFISRKCCWRRSREDQEEEENPQDRRSSSCWYDEPPPYVEAVEEMPPPTYQEAVAKENDAPNGPREREIHPTAAPVTTSEPTPAPAPAPVSAPAPVHAPVRRGVETVSTSHMPHPNPAIYTNYAHLALHM